MKSETLVTALTSLTTAMAVAAPMVVFGFLYVLKIHPERVSAHEAQVRLATAEAALQRQRLLAVAPSDAAQVTAFQELDASATDDDRVGDVIDALTTLLKSPGIGGVMNLSISPGRSTEGPHTPVTIAFDARYEQIGRFFWNLRALPAVFDVRSVDLASARNSGAAMIRVNVLLHVVHRASAATPARSQVDVITAPVWKRDPFATIPRPSAPSNAPSTAPAPVVTSILVSGGRRFARVDGRIVGAGDRVGDWVVRAIESDAVIVADASGRVRRIPIERRAMPAARR